jgi:hypothetical protein
MPFERGMWRKVVDLPAPDAQQTPVYRSDPLFTCSISADQLDRLGREPDTLAAAATTLSGY